MTAEEERREQQLLLSWRLYSEACFTHDLDEPVVAHAQELEQAA